MSTDTIDLDGYRAAMGFTEETDAITFRDLQERRELIAKRLEAHQHPRRRVPLLKAVYRMVRPARDPGSTGAESGTGPPRRTA